MSVRIEREFYQSKNSGQSLSDASPVVTGQAEAVQCAVVDCKSGSRPLTGSAQSAFLPWSKRKPVDLTNPERTKFIREFPDAYSTLDLNLRHVLADTKTKSDTLIKKFGLAAEGTVNQGEKPLESIGCIERRTYLGES